MSKSQNRSNPAQEVLISSDSHVIEPAELLKQRVAQAFRDRAPLFKHQALGGGFQAHPGGADPNSTDQRDGNRRLERRGALPDLFAPHFRDG